MTALAVLVLGQTTLKPYTLAGFKIGLPAVPVATPIPGAPAKSQSWSSKTPGGTTLQFFYVEGNDKQSDDRMLANFVAGFLNTSHATLARQDDILLNGWAGLDATMTGPGSSVRGESVWVRAFAFPNALLCVTGRGGPASKSLVDAVFASLEVDPKRGLGPHFEAGPVWTRTPIASPYSLEFPAKIERRDQSAASGPHVEGWTSLYGNRFYASFVTTFPENSAEEIDLKAAIEIADDAALVSSRATLVSRKATTVLGRPAEFMEATSPDGKSFVLFQTSASLKELIIQGVVVPKCLRNSPETVRFLASLRGTEEKTPAPKTPGR